MFSRWLRIFEENGEVLGPEINETVPDAPPVYTEIDDNEKRAVEVCEPPPNPSFEPVERQRHFGILRYTVNTRFRKLMLIGVANIVIVIGLFLFIYFTALAPKSSTVTTVTVQSTTRALTVTVRTITQRYAPEAITTTITPAKTFPPNPTSRTTSVSTTPICTDGFSLANNKCLKIAAYRATHDYSASACAYVGGTLFTAKTREDNIAMNKFLKDRNTDNVWMGLFCIGNSASQCFWDNGGDSAVSYSSFVSGYPSISSGKCVYYKTSTSSEGSWMNGECENGIYLMCELPTTTYDTCDNNFNNNCYFPQWGGGVTLPQAIQICADMCATVASVHSDAENRYLTKFFAGYPQDYFILLGGMVTDSGYISWLDGTPMDYNNMQFDRGGNCLLMSVGGGGFYKTECTTFAWFICKRPTGVTCEARSDPPMVTVAPYPVPQTCNTGLMMAPGAFTSPNYPGNYTNNLSCTYYLVTTGGNRINLTFTDFDTEFNYDVVYIYDGEPDGSVDPNDGTPHTTASSSAQVYSGRLGSFWVVSSGPVMSVKFTTDQSNVMRGFNAIFSSIYQTASG